MELGDFLVHCVEKSVQIHYTIGDWGWYDYQKLAELTEHINYHCNFKPNGSCRGYNMINNGICCCYFCFSSIGHHKELPCNYNQLMAYCKLFEPEKKGKNGKLEALGFWRAGKGCILPRKMRSSICLSYNCRSAEEITPWSRKLLSLLNCKKRNMTVYGKRCQHEWQAKEQMEKWLKAGQRTIEKKE
jgi:hypothetical protein